MKAARDLMIARYGWDASKMDPEAFALFARALASARAEGEAAILALGAYRFGQSRPAAPQPEGEPTR